jgi:hypothetical protein
VTAVYTLKTYTLTYNAGSNGSITGTTPQVVNYGGSGTQVTALADIGYYFVEWSDNLSTVASRTDTNVTANLTTTASFAATINPLPTMSNISPLSATAGDPGFTITVNGTNFTASSTVNFNGSTLATTFISSVQLTAQVLANNLLVAGTFNVIVTNPTPGGGTSNAQTFNVNNLVPTTTSISPNTKTEGDAQFVMTINGTNFVASSTVNFAGSARATTYINAGQLTAVILTSDLVTANTFSITVTNPTPGGGTSNAQTLTVNSAPALAPTISTIVPTSATVGDSLVVLVVNGTNFATSSLVRFNGVDHVITFFDSTQISAQILAGELAVAGDFIVKVSSPFPSGLLSNEKIFTVNASTTPIRRAARAPELRPVTIEFSGKTFPDAKILVVGKDNKIETMLLQDTTTGANGDFTVSYIGVTQSQYIFGLTVKDKDNRVSQTKFFDVDVTSNRLVVKDVLVPPTVGFINSSIKRGNNLVIMGYAPVRHLVRIEIDGKMIGEVVAGGDGSYRFEVNTGPMALGSYVVRAKQIDAAGKASDYSISQTFSVSQLSVEAAKADFNDDGSVDVQDWSIFLSKWSSTDSAVRREIDLNGDGVTDISDLSIFIRNVRK